MMNDFTKEELEQKLELAHKDNGECQSCGWHAAFYEMDYNLTGEIIDGKAEYFDYCKNPDDEIDHRGCYIYLDVNHE